MDDTLAMYIFVNCDLGMSKGKIGSQIGHAVMIMVEYVIRQGYEIYPPPNTYLNYMKWRSNCTKIILKANAQQISDLSKKDCSFPFIDDGQTTVVGFLPNPEMASLVKDFKLL